MAQYGDWPCLSSLLQARFTVSQWEGASARLVSGKVEKIIQKILSQTFFELSKKITRKKINQILSKEAQIYNQGSA